MRSLIVFPCRPRPASGVLRSLLIPAVPNPTPRAARAVGAGLLPNPESMELFSIPDLSLRNLYVDPASAIAPRRAVIMGLRVVVAGAEGLGSAVNLILMSSASI